MNEMKTIPPEVAALIPAAQLMVTKDNLSAYPKYFKKPKSEEVK